MCDTAFNLYKVYKNNYKSNCCFDILLSQLFAILLTTFFVSNNTFPLDLYNGNLQTTTLLFTTQCVFTQDWLNYYYWIITACFVLSFNMRMWLILMKVLEVESFYCAYIFVCVFCRQCLWLRSHAIPFFLILMLLLVYL